MTIQASDTVLNAMLDAIETAAGTGVLVKIRTGAAPSTTAGADTGTVVASLTLASDWAAAAASHAKAFNNLPLVDSSADATGAAAHWRLYNSAGTTCHLQGSVGTSGTDMIVDNTSFVAGQSFSITAWTLNLNANA